MGKAQPGAGAQQQDVELALRHPFEMRGIQCVKTKPGPRRDLDAARGQQQAGLKALAVDEDMILAIACEERLAGVGVEMKLHAETLADPTRQRVARLPVPASRRPVSFAGAGRLR